MHLNDTLFEPPAVNNTDGEPLSFRRPHYTIASPEDAFQALTPLCAHISIDELRTEAELDANGQMHKIEFSWSREGQALSKGVDNTILGNISIEGNTMTIEVNSEGREKKDQRGNRQEARKPGCLQSDRHSLP